MLDTASATTAPATRRGRSIADALGAAVLWGTTGTSAHLAPSSATPQAIGTMRITIAALTLALWTVPRRGLRAFTCFRPRDIPMLALAVIGLGGYQVFFFRAVDAAGVAVGTVVTLATAPVLAGIVGRIEGRKAGWLWWAATALTLAGVAILAATGSDGAGDRPAAGVVLAVLAGSCYATYTMSAQKLVQRGFAQDVTMTLVFCVGAVLLAPTLFVVDLSWLGSWKGIAVALWLGIPATAIAYALFTRALNVIPATMATTLGLAEPLTAALLSLVILGQQVSAAGYLGMVIIAVGLFLTGRKPPSQP